MLTDLRLTSLRYLQICSHGSRLATGVRKCKFGSARLQRFIHNAHGLGFPKSEHPSEVNIKEGQTLHLLWPGGWATGGSAQGVSRGS